MLFDRIFSSEVLESTREEHVHVADLIFNNIGKSLFKAELSHLTAEYGR
jgi:hypothetical protein